MKSWNRSVQSRRISAGNTDESLSTSETNDLTFDALSDDGGTVADCFCIAYELTDNLKAVAKGFGMDFSQMNGNDGRRAEKVPVTATFVVNNDGEVVYSFAELDSTKRAKPANIIAAVKQAVEVV